MQEGIHKLDQGVLRVLCLVRVHGPEVEHRTLLELMASGGIITDNLSYCRDSGLLFEHGGKYRITEFWKEQVENPGFISCIEKAATPYQLFELWKNSFHVDIPTPNMRVQLLAHAKRLLKTREFEYWQRTIELCLKDDFWKKVAGNSIASLEKAAVQLKPTKRSKSEEVFGA